MKHKRMHHVGIVLPTQEAVDHLMTTLDLEEEHRGYVEAYQADLIFTRCGDQESPIEFIVPREGSVLQKYNKYNDGRGGLHIAFEVDDVEEVRRDFEAKGLHMLEPKAVEATVSGADDLVFNFMRPRYSEQILFEFVQTVAPVNRSA